MAMLTCPQSCEEEEEEKEEKKEEEVEGEREGEKMKAHSFSFRRLEVSQHKVPEKRKKKEKKKEVLLLIGNKHTAAFLVKKKNIYDSQKLIAADQKPTDYRPLSMTRKNKT